MYQFMVTIKKNQQGIDWGTLISNEIDSQMTTVLSTGKFYMFSYVAYAAAGMRSYPGLDTKGSRTTNPVYKYYPQITKKGSKDHFRRVNDAFFYENICQLNPGLRKTRVSDEAWTEVSKWGCIFLQFKKFTYLRTVMYSGEPFRLPRYPGDRLILIELVRQLLDFHKFQQSKHKAAVSFPISIGRYTCSTVAKAKNVECELQEKLKKHMKSRDGFDIRGVLRTYGALHLHRPDIEDIWVDLRNEVAVRRKDNSRLTINEIQTLELSDLPDGTTDNESVLDMSYDGLNEDRYVFPPIDWSASEKASITDRSALILARTKKWLSSWGMNFKDDKFPKLAETEVGPSQKKKDKESSGGSIKIRIPKKRKERQISSIVSPAQTVVVPESPTPPEIGEINLEEGGSQLLTSPFADCSTGETLSLAFKALETESVPPPQQPLQPPHSPSTSSSMANIFSGLSPLSAGTQVITNTPPQPVPLFIAPTTTLAVVPPPIVESSPLESRIPVTTTLAVSSDTPQWLLEQTPRKRKVIVPLPAFDFSSLKASTARSAKKPKTVSRVLVDASGDKFAEIATPSADKTRDDVTAADYQVTRVALGKVTAKGAQQDAKDSIDVLCQKLKETKDSRNELKEKVEQLTEVLIKLSTPLESIPSSSVSAGFDFSSVPTIEKIAKKGRVVDEWIQKLLQQGKEVIQDVVKVHQSLGEIQKEGEKMDEEFTEEIGQLDLTCEALQVLKQIPAHLLVEEGVLPHTDKHFQLIKAIKFRVKILNEACSKLRESRDKLIDGKSDLEEELLKICPKVSVGNAGILSADDLFKQVQESIQHEPVHGFDLEVIGQFVRIEHTLEALRKLSKGLKKLPGTASDVHETCEMWNDHSTAPDENEMQGIIRKFQEFRNKQSQLEEEKEEEAKDDDSD
ncbi:hypothetical protein KI387_003415 [Taxus chinensis]|uniref:Uncharacterized protein n=5 Tax=Taxus chinensis TaxID=29808 RepID=A0AA38H1A3_TAXCH|nr:hypothetical protein KI387_003415 [Taxus chinensis]